MHLRYRDTLFFSVISDVYGTFVFFYFYGDFRVARCAWAFLCAKSNPIFPFFKGEVAESPSQLCVCRRGLNCCHRDLCVSVCPAEGGRVEA